MTLVKTYPFSGATVSAEYSGGNGVISGGNTLAFAAGQIHAQITSTTANQAYSQDDFGTDLTQGVCAIQNFKLPTAWTAGAAGNVLEVLNLTKADFTQAVVVWITNDGKWQFRIPGTGVMNSSGITSAAGGTVVANTNYQVELAFVQNSYVQLYVNGTKVCEVTGLAGGTGAIRRVAGPGFITATGTWTATVDLYADEMKIDNDPTARPYSAVGGSNPANPTSIVQVDAADATLQASVTFTTPTGYKLMYKSGANATPPTGPTDGAWTAIATVSTGSGQRTVQVTLPANDTFYSIAVFSYDGSLYSLSSAQCNAIALAPAVIVSFTSTYIVMRIQTAKQGSMKVEINSTNSWSEGAADLFTYATRSDAGSGWRLYGAAEDYTSLTAGAPLGSSSFPAASNNKYLRKDFPSLTGTPFAKAYEGVTVT